MSQHNLSLQAPDGYRLAASLFKPNVQVDSQSDPHFIVVGSATAVPRGFYKRFAEYAAARGVHVVTTDYRGVGDSKHGPLRGFTMDYADWSKQDLAAAVAWCAERGRTWMVGHSLGAHAIGQLPNPNVLQAAYVCGGGAGWHAWIPFPENLKVWALWHLVGPLATRWYGYQPMSKFGFGEDVPLGVYRDWKRWCQYPHYFFDDPDARAITARFADVHVPIAAVTSIDDLWAPPKSRDAFFKGYSNAPVSRIDLSPGALGVPQVGHMGYFRAAVGAQLWLQMLAWLAQHGLRVSDMTPTQTT